jgi:hypothetical protein
MASERTINMLSEFTSFVEPECLDEYILFRGQPHDDPLLPKIARLDLNGDLAEVERRMLAEFQRQSIPFLDRICDNDWDWLALAQHHGMATRLLDWTKNPLAALWFGVRQPPDSEGDGVVWVFTPAQGDILTADKVRTSRQGPFEGTRTQVFQPNCVTSRIVAQGGWFTVHKYLREEHRFIPLEKNKIHRQHLTKLRIPAKVFSELRYQLDRFGVNCASMFPDLDGICRHVEWLNCFLADENRVPETATSKAQPPGRKRKAPL